MKVVFSKEHVDIEYKNKKARFVGELASPCFFACANSMKWLSPDKDRMATKEEQDEWVEAINKHFENEKRRVIFADEEFEKWDEEAKCYRAQLAEQKFRIIDYKEGDMLLAYNRKNIGCKAEKRLYGMVVRKNSMEWINTVGIRQKLSDVEITEVISEAKKHRKKINIKFI